MNGEINLTLSDGRVIPCKFGTYAMKRICDLQDCTLLQFFEKVETSSFDIDFIAHMIFACAEWAVKRQKKQPDFDIIDVYEWIDDVGGIGGEKLQLFFQQLVESMIVKEEKKSEINGTSIVAV